ncbi:hypothetical protein EYF80_038128 [Liparis tanakae]|uniref:Uncharacterized protein n=1 Tax=Liparis tanakae TaxID=230148 RepID=A0A4Z2GDN9_9TELE|nr:hypothetical protein EYF80_038128 [Liparis tanakae]
MIKAVTAAGPFGHSLLISSMLPKLTAPCDVFLLSKSYQVVQLWVLAEEGLVFSLLLMHKVLNVHIEAG